MQLTIDEVFELIKAERARQDAKYGGLDEKKQSVAGYMLIMKKELVEAEDGWMKNVDGKHSALSEIVQIAATAVACLRKLSM